MSEQAKSTSKYSLVRAIVTLFKLGEEGKIENFFARERKALERQVSKLEKALDVTEFNHKNALEDLADKIVDATAAIENAYTQVDAERVSSNSDCDSFASSYWRNIELAEANLKTLEEEQESVVEKYNATVKASKLQIAERKRRLSKISAEK
jgi:vacuolar-type H+-ATPase catalytic subunit A/Vma1